MNHENFSMSARTLWRIQSEQIGNLAIMARQNGLQYIFISNKPLFGTASLLSSLYIDSQ